MNKPAHKNDRETFPDVAEKIGEDPARYLDVDLVEKGSELTSTTGRDLALARIRGIDKLGVVNAWLLVERQLDRGPRDAIIRVLEARRDHLLEHGDRELPGLSREQLRARSESKNEADDSTVWEHEACGSIDVEQRSPVAWYCPECDVSTNQVVEVEPEAVEA